MPFIRYVLYPATIWRSDSEWKQEGQPDVGERFHRFFLEASVLFRYLMLKLKIFGGRLHCLLVCSLRMDFKTCFVFL